LDFFASKRGGSLKEMRDKKTLKMLVFHMYIIYTLQFIRRNFKKEIYSVKSYEGLSGIQVLLHMSI
jgi:hypothetical protein